MVFVDAAIAWRDRKLAERFRKGLEHGREDAHQTWSDWYARFTDAKARGVPFREAPPEAPPTP